MDANEKKKENVIGYARVSTVQQNEDRQIIALLEAGVPKKNIFIDKYSGKDFDRPQYKKMLKKLNNNTVLFIKSIDRLGRDYTDLGEQWRVITKEIGSDLVVIDMPLLDTRREKNLLGTFITDLVLCLLSYVSAQELSMIHARQAEGVAAAKARGVKFGRPPKPLPNNFEDVFQKWDKGEISTAEAARRVNMPVSTYRYRANKIKKE